MISRKNLHLTEIEHPGKVPKYFPKNPLKDYIRIPILINILKGVEVKKFCTFSRNFRREVKKNHT